MNTPYAFQESARGSLVGLAAASPHGFPFVNRKGEPCRVPGFECAARLTAEAWWARQHGPAQGASIRFEDRCEGQLGHWAWHGSPAPVGEDFLGGTRHVIEVSGAGLDAWLHTPAERAAAYLQWFAQVSFDLQVALRCWMPYLMLRQAAIRNDFELCGSLLFYAASRPYFARVRGLFTWDVICPDSMASVYRSGAQGLPAALNRAQRYVAAAGFEGAEALVNRLAPSETRAILIHVRRDPRVLKGLLAMEGKLVESLLTLGGKGRELASTETAPKNLHRFCSEWAQGVQTKLRRTIGGMSMPGLVDLALVESTASLAACAGLPVERRELTIADSAATELAEVEVPPAQAA